jgi:putative membrane protein
MTRRNLWIVVGVVVVVALVIVGLVVAGLVWGGNHYTYGPHMMPGYRYPFQAPMFGRGILGLVFWLVILGGGALLVAGLVALFTRGRRPSGQALPPAEPQESAIEILRRRYARGEITREEYDMMKETITGETS